MSAAIANAGLRILAVTEALLEGRDLGPLAELAILQGLTHVSVRDAVIAQLLGHGDVADDLVRGVPVSMTWLHHSPTEPTLARALSVLDHLSEAGRREASTRNALGAIRALLLWLGRRPLEAQLAISEVSPDYPLATAIVEILSSGYEPLCPEN